MQQTTTKRVLLVDDDEVILETTQFALQQQGYEVLIARDGTEALMRAERDAPDLIILDVVMPRRSGFAVLARLRRSPRRCPRIMMVSGDGDGTHQAAAEYRGADAFLQKPYEMSHLLSEVRTLLK